MFQAGAVKAQSSSHRFTGKPEQNITTKIRVKKDDGSMVRHMS